MAAKVRSWTEKLYRIFTNDLPGETGGVYVPETSSLRVQANNESQFGEIVTAGRTPIIELNSSFGTSILRDVVTTTGSGSKDDINGTLDTGEISISTGTTANSSSLLESAEVARYIPGYGAEVGVGARLTPPLIGEQIATWGAISPKTNEDGFYFQYDSDGFAIVREREGVKTIVRQSEFNRDTVDGSGGKSNPSGINLDFSAGCIFQIDYTLYGYGGVKFSVVTTASGRFQRPIPLHVLPPSSFSGTSVKSPSLRVFSKVENGSTEQDLTLFTGGRQFSIVGNYVPKYRYTGETRTDVSVGTTVVPLISFRFKDAYLDRSVKLDEYDFSNTGNVPIIPEIRIGGTLTGATFNTPTNYTATETALETDVSATAITGGDVIYAGDIVGSAKDGSKSFTNLDLDLPGDQTVTLCARSFSGNQSCYSGFRLKEEW